MDIPVTRKTRWWQLNYFVFSPRKLFGEVFHQFWRRRICFRLRLVQPPTRDYYNETKCHHLEMGSPTWGIFFSWDLFFSQYELSGFSYRKQNLGGGNSKIFLFSPRKLGKIPILTHIFQMGWNQFLHIINHWHHQFKAIPQRGSGTLRQWWRESAGFVGLLVTQMGRCPRVQVGKKNLSFGREGFQKGANLGFQIDY